ncbi:MAG: DUF3568 family protein [Gemmatimonadota bacterium]
MASRHMVGGHMASGGHLTGWSRGAALAALAALGAGGCVVAGAGAGAGGAVYLTSRGVESVITAPLASVASATERAFADLEIRRTGLEIDDEDGSRVYRGEPEEGDPDVTVTLESEESGSTKVEVTARTSVVTWDKEYARRVIERIVDLSG